MLDYWLLSCLYEKVQPHTLLAWVMVKAISLTAVILQLGAWQLAWIIIAGVSRGLSVLWFVLIISIGVYKTLISRRRSRLKTKLHNIASKNLGKKPTK